MKKDGVKDSENVFLYHQTPSECAQIYTFRVRRVLVISTVICSFYWKWAGARWEMMMSCTLWAPVTTDYLNQYQITAEGLFASSVLSNNSDQTTPKQSWWGRLAKILGVSLKKTKTKTKNSWCNRGQGCQCKMVRQEEDCKTVKDGALPCRWACFLMIATGPFSHQCCAIQKVYTQQLQWRWTWRHC